VFLRTYFATLRLVLFRSSDADFIEVIEQIARVLIDAIGAGAAEFFLPVSAR
jgi:hypothetical protein